MTLVPLTLAISLCLAFTLVVFFLREQMAGRPTKITESSVQRGNRPMAES